MTSRLLRDRTRFDKPGAYGVECRILSADLAATHCSSQISDSADFAAS
jgi:hypothetical protein